METQLKNEPGLILVHVEPQAYVQKNFNERMIIYFSRLYEKYRRRILPVAVFSYDRIHDEPDSFELRLPFLDVLNFRFYKLELKKLNWREYIQSDNPVAAVRRAIMSEKRRTLVNEPLVLHSDNGSPMKGASLLETLYQLGVTPSRSRPRVSNDNPYAESIFRTCKYRPNYPAKGFASLSEARQWVQSFITWYNQEHRHSGLNN